jgi:hypothetical protein
MKVNFCTSVKDLLVSKFNDDSTRLEGRNDQFIYKASIYMFSYDKVTQIDVIDFFGTIFPQEIPVNRIRVVKIGMPYRYYVYFGTKVPREAISNFFGFIQKVSMSKPDKYLMIVIPPAAIENDPLGAADHYTDVRRIIITMSKFLDLEIDWKMLDWVYGGPIDPD